MSKFRIETGSKLAIHANKVTDALFAHIEQAASQGTPFAVVKLTQEFTGLRTVKARNLADVAPLYFRHSQCLGVALWALVPGYGRIAHQFSRLFRNDDDPLADFLVNTTVAAQMTKGSS